MQTEPINEISRNSKYFMYVAIAFVVILMISNTVAVKLVQIGPFVFAGAIFIFPISYIFGDILTEVYGYKASRKIIWSGFVALVMMSFFYYLVQILPAPVFWQNQTAYDLILGSVPRIVFGSIIAYFVGEFSNSYVLSKMKIWSKGKHLWIRTIGSTVVGEGVDSFIFGFIAFGGLLPLSALMTLILSGYFAKVLYEIILTPATYFIVRKLKQDEGIDVYDRNVNYNPLRF
jgi:queuosine precursor transporter